MVALPPLDGAVIVDDEDSAGYLDMDDGEPVNTTLPPVPARHRPERILPAYIFPPVDEDEETEVSLPDAPV